MLLSADWGDAPDIGPGTGLGNYNTLAGDNGPSHEIVAGFLLGNSVDADSGTLENATANADDVDGGLPDDEDGVLSPLDMLGTVGAQPTVTLEATNTTGTAATLYGWIDHNQDGVFDNATERAQIAVPDATTDGLFTLTFPAILPGLAGATYARFRLSTDAAAANSTGAAGDGEVEDYVFTITGASSGTVKSSVKIAHQLNGGPSLVVSDHFGESVARLGDLDGDGIADLAVGASGDDTGGNTRGAVYVLFMNADGTAKSSVKIAHQLNGGPTLANGDYFGSSVTSLGDLDGDGVVDLAVGAAEDDTGFVASGAVYVLFMNADGTAKSSVKIAHQLNGGPTFFAGLQYFSRSLAPLGDLDGDGLTDLAVGSDGFSAYRGAVYVLFMNANGTAKGSQRLTWYTDWSRFGSSVAALGDLDRDGIADLAVGADRDDLVGGHPGAVYVLFMNADGTAKSRVRIAHELNGGPTLADLDRFGSSAASLGDLDGDGIADLGVGAAWDDTGGTNRGAAYVLFLNADGTAKSNVKIASGVGGGPTLANGDYFGSSVTSLGDLDGDGIADLGVGAAWDDTGPGDRGAVHVLFLSPPPATVVGRHLFYNQSKYDGNNAGIDPADSSAIATNKSAYLPGGGVITPSSMTSYSRGINGIMVDFAGSHGTLSLADFTFKMSEQGAAANDTPSTWVAAPTPTGFTVLADTPAVGTDRVEFIWPQGSITNRYLEVIVKGNDMTGGNNTNTGLAASDIFFFGNRIGDDFIGTSATTFVTSAADEIDARVNPGFLQPLTNVYDYDKNGIVNAADQIIARGNGGFMFRIDIASPPAAPDAAAMSSQIDDGHSVPDPSSASVAFAVASTKPETQPRAIAANSLVARHVGAALSPRRVDALFAQFARENGPQPAATFAAPDQIGDARDLNDELLDNLIAALF